MTIDPGTSGNPSAERLPDDATVTLLLVHGAFHSAGSWARLVEVLADRGISALAVDLPGHGEDSAPLADLRGDAARVAAHANTVNGPVVLVGHSYGGAVIAEAANACSRAVACIFIAGFALLGGESITQVQPEQPIPPTETPEITMLAADVGAITEASARRLFYHDCSDAEAAEALRQLSPQRMSALAQAPTTSNWQSMPSAYLVCTDDRAVPPVLQEYLARRATRTYRISGSHSPFASRPIELAELLGQMIADQVDLAPFGRR